MAYIQSTSLAESTSSTTTAKAYGSNITAGSLLVAVCYWNSASLTCAVTDSQTNGWTPVGSPLTGAGALAAFRSQLFYCPSGKTGATTVTMTVSGTVTSRGLAIHEYGPSSFSGLTFARTDSRNITGVGTLLTSGSINVSTNDLVLSGVIVGGSITAGGAGYSLRENTNFGSNGTEDKTGAAGSTTATYTDSSSGGDASIHIIAFGAPATTVPLIPPEFILAQFGLDPFLLTPPPLIATGAQALVSSLAATLSFTGSQSRSTAKLVSGGLSFTGSLIRSIVHLLAATLSFTGSLVKRTARALAGGLSFVGSLASSRVTLQALSATLSFTGSQARSVGKKLSAGVSFTGSQLRSVAKLIAGGLSFTGSQVRAVTKLLTAAGLSFTGGVARRTGHLFSAGVSFVGSLTSSRVTLKALSATLSFTGAVSKQTGKGLSASVSFTGSCARAVGKGVSATLSFTGSTARRTAKAIAGAVGFVGSVIGNLLGITTAATATVTTAESATSAVTTSENTATATTSESSTAAGTTATTGHAATTITSASGTATTSEG